MRWRCRRGMRELDAMLTAYLDHLASHSSLPDEQTFSKLLNCEDDQLWDWLSGKVACPDPELVRIIDDIRTTH
jgi:antitoxin CptB